MEGYYSFAVSIHAQDKGVDRALFGQRNLSKLVKNKIVQYISGS
jgi:hypothetical protein